MNDPNGLISKASVIVGNEQRVIAAGIFGLKDDYVAVGLGTVAGAIVSDVLLDVRSPVPSGAMLECTPPVVRSLHHRD